MNFNLNHIVQNRKLGYLIHEGAAATPLIDLQMFIDALNEKGIPCYIDYENKDFHYNTTKKTFK